MTAARPPVGGVGWPSPRSAAPARSVRDDGGPLRGISLALGPAALWWAGLFVAVEQGATATVFWALLGGAVASGLVLLAEVWLVEAVSDRGVARAARASVELDGVIGDRRANADPIPARPSGAADELARICDDRVDAWGAELGARRRLARRRRSSSYPGW